MELQRFKCLKHDRINEVFCKGCNTYICAKCVSDHASDGHEAKYVHILHYAPQEVLPKIDSLLVETKGKEKQLEKEIEEITSTLKEIVPKAAELINLQDKKSQQLLKGVKQLKVFANNVPKASYSDLILKGLKMEKSRLQKALVEKNEEGALKVALKIEAEAALNRSQETPKELNKEMEEAVKKLEEVKVYEEALAAAGMLLSKCMSLRVTQGGGNWTCDRQYLSSKMFLSEDGLTFGNIASDGYPAIIGTMPFDFGMYAFRVIPEGLDCTGNEGFGIIEKEKYLAAYKQDPVTPTVYDKIIGFMYDSDVKNMTSDMVSSMQMGARYYVRVNMIDCNINITGPGLLLTAKLKPDVEYYPCFSCGCSGNKLHIKPLENYDDVEEVDSDEQSITVFSLELKLSLLEPLLMFRYQNGNDDITNNYYQHQKTKQCSSRLKSSPLVFQCKTTFRTTERRVFQDRGPIPRPNPFNMRKTQGLFPS
eukprot:TRINITY_DN105184_c1_g1_i1.p2 TRINITY_DN105184_c1_g1~~TRINITY_DN105184_c1_g1_i1.p2  ORF type:complete len:479 (-),score=45.65 TRINITY_DN105184_c1_g1_i1:408-1844(-)